MSGMNPYMITLVVTWFTQVLQLFFLVLAVGGAVQCAVTRDDAFTVIDRSKQTWVMLLAGSAVALLLNIFILGIPFIWIVVPVILGVYWQDVRPAVRDLLS
ncbi:hypothetical protein CBOVI_01440 [Corynebacterium bovis DSM 20582 = CIP 54.80]|nr:hypothetical protein CBOVI_01440 [Corynebacterium bovis DSM 20582 = CIP 54.80]